MRIFLAALILAIQSSLFAGTQDFVDCDVIVVKTDVVYFDAGSAMGIAPGETFDIFYSDILVASGKIGWADKYISRSEELDIETIAAIYFDEGLKARINLFVPQANRGGYLSIPYLTDLNLEPRMINTPEDKMVARLIHRGLLTRDIENQIVPDIAGTFEVRGLTYTFYINPLAEFHSGRPVEASDVAYSFESLALSPKLTSAGCYVLAIKGAEEFRHRTRNEISGIFLINRKTISVTLKEPFPAFEEYLAGPGGYIIPRPGLEPPGGNVVGAGNYKIKGRNPDGLTVEPFGEDNTSAYLDSISFVRFKSLDEAGLSFELGRLDLITALGEPPPKFVSGDGHTSMTTRTICAAVLGVNGLRDYQKNLHFSKALTYLIDRETIIRVILGGSGAMANDLTFGYDDNGSFVNPDSVDRYLNAIVKMPSTVSLYVDSRHPSLFNVARYISGQLQSVGIKVKEKKVDLLFLEEDHTRSDIDLYLDYHSPVSLDPDCVLYPLYSYSLSGQTNYLYDKDEALSVFLSKLRAETDPERREMLAAGLIRSVAEEPPAVVLYQPFLTTILKADVSGLRPLEEGYLDLRGAFIENK
ncbi:MAG: ABC transporter substrate-binding protein [candidate division Zixibacteria bacterium]